MERARRILNYVTGTLVIFEIRVFKSPSSIIDLSRSSEYPIEGFEALTSERFCFGKDP